MTKSQPHQWHAPVSPSQEVGAIAAGICHECLRRFGHDELGTSPMFVAVNTETMQYREQQEHQMESGCSYVLSWMPGEAEVERPPISLFRVQISDFNNLVGTLQMTYENGGVKTHSVYELADPTSLDRLYDGIRGIIKELLDLIPASDRK